MFKIGDTVWVPDCGNEQVQIPCPICFGKKEVVLILGNDERMILPCEGCGLGFEGPRGYVMEYRPHTGSSPRTIMEVRISNTSSGQEIEYLSLDHYCLKPEACFSTKEEAEMASVEKMKCLKEKEAKRIKYDDRKNYAWNARYHTGEAKRAQRDLEYHSRMAKLCKESSKEA